MNIKKQIRFECVEFSIKLETNKKMKETKLVHI